MSADRELFNRRELRQSLGTRTNRRAWTKKHTNNDPESRNRTKRRPAARLNEKIEKIRRENG